MDFYLDDLELARYAEPAITSVTPLNGLLYSDAKSVRAEVGLAGLPEGETSAVTCTLTGGAGVLGTGTARLARGTGSVLIRFDRPLPPGDYGVQARIDGTERILTQPIRVVASPWE